MSGFPSGSVILAPSNTLENASEKEAPSTAPVSPVRLVTEASEGGIPLIEPLDSHYYSLGVLSINSSQDELQLEGSTSVDGALPDTRSPPLKARASIQVNRVPVLFVKHQSGLTDAEKRKNLSLPVENSTETLILSDSMVSRITDIEPYKNVQIHVFSWGKDTASDPGFSKLQEKGLYKIKKCNYNVWT